ncbi:transcription termination factor 2-like [Stegodyphus dumicola]|uniref:transcription termination factor 2-like n=1 Tax=Stegodyphus dumicola TaxID=202533 RepID=UPI0015AAABCA|nr:transcription termination factor 2-like [Stegodyphus dumicola]
MEGMEAKIIQNQIESKKKLLKTVNLSVLHDKGAKLKNQIAELEKALQDFKLPLEEVDLEKKCNITSADSLPGHSLDQLSKTVSENGEHLQGSSSNVSSKEISTSVSELSFEQLSKMVAKDSSSKPMFDSPSFKNWRGEKVTRHIKLTEPKPLVECLTKKSIPGVGTTNAALPLENEASVKKLHASLVSYTDETKEEEEPLSLLTSLMKHQKRALAWLLWRENQLPSGGILADDMGLGKTLTILSLILKQKENKNFLSSSQSGNDICKGTLIVCMASIIHQWKDEICRHCGSNVSVFIYHGPKRQNDPRLFKLHNITLTTYSILLSERKAHMSTKADKALFLLKWERIILDEAHTIKNHKSQTAEAVFSLKSFRRWCVTGTPIHNNFDDMYPLIKFLQFPTFDDYKKWKALISDVSDVSKKRRNMLVKSILLRRTKSDTTNDGKPLVKMTKKKYDVCFIELDDDEMKEYVKFQKKINEKVKKYFDLRLMHKNANTSSSLLVYLLRLQQCCNHLSLLGEEIEEEILPDTLKEISCSLSSLKIKDSNVTETDHDNEQSLELSLTEYQEKKLTDRSVKSTKLKKLFSELKKISEESEEAKSVIVSQWVSMLEIVAYHLRKEGFKYHMIAGNTKPEDRQTAADDFNKNRLGSKIMLLSLKAGGVGLNLTGASHLFLMDLHWNPALEMQACDRIHRLDQKKDVVIHKFICKNTIEEKILDLQKSKSYLADTVLHGAGRVTKGISLDDFKTLFSIKI